MRGELVASFVVVECRSRVWGSGTPRCALPRLRGSSLITLPLLVQWECCRPPSTKKVPRRSGQISTSLHNTQQGLCRRCGASNYSTMASGAVSARPTTAAPSPRPYRRLYRCLAKLSRHERDSRRATSHGHRSARSGSSPRRNLYTGSLRVAVIARQSYERQLHTLRLRRPGIARRWARLSTRP